jgi:hypothetical protein
LKAREADALLVSCADKLHNARAILTDPRAHGVAAFDRFTGRVDGRCHATRASAAPGR